MHYRRASPLSQRAANALDTCRAAVASKPGRLEKAKEARARFSAKSARVSWKEIRAKLARARPSGSNCHYCELDRYRDIDHVYPLSIYPDEAFNYENYVYSCVICNQNRKREGCAHISGGDVVHLEKYCRNDDPLPHGVRALINPRTEDPSVAFEIDLETGALLVRENIDPILSLRAQYTISLLHLNDPNLARARRSARREYISLSESIARAIRDDDNELFARLFSDIFGIGKPTVVAGLLENIGQYPEFRDSFAAIEEDVGFQAEDLLYY